MHLRQAHVPVDRKEAAGVLALLTNKLNEPEIFETASTSQQSSLLCAFRQHSIERMLL